MKNKVLGRGRVHEYVGVAVLTFLSICTVIFINQKLSRDRTWVRFNPSQPVSTYTRTIRCQVLHVHVRFLGLFSRI